VVVAIVVAVLVSVFLFSTMLHPLHPLLHLLFLLQVDASLSNSAVSCVVVVDVR